MSGPDVVMKAINVLSAKISLEPNSALKNVYLSQTNQLKIAVLKETIELTAEEWESRYRPERHLAIAILNELSPGWYRG